MRQLAKTRATAMIAIATFGALLGLSGCTKAAEPDMAVDPATSVEQWQHDFERCMRDEGVELGEGGGIPVNSDGSFGGTGDSGDFEAALQKCTTKLGPAPQAEGGVSDVELEALMLRFAKCMREAGYDVPDPTFDSDGSNVLGVPDADPADVERCTTEAGLDAAFGTGE